MGAVDAQKAISHVRVCTVDEFASADAVIFGTPTRFGNMCGQMRQLLEATGSLWAQAALVGKVGSLFTSNANAEWRPGIYHPLVSYFATASRLCDLGPALCLSGPDEDRQNNGRVTIRRFDDRWWIWGAHAQ
jgi:hypothetical protein